MATRLKDPDGNILVTDLPVKFTHNGHPATHIHRVEPFDGGPHIMRWMAGSRYHRTTIDGFLRSINKGDIVLI